MSATIERILKDLTAYPATAAYCGITHFNTKDAIAEPTALREAVRKGRKSAIKYGRHLDNCTANDGWKCNCGFNAALAAIDAVLPKETK